MFYFMRLDTRLNGASVNVNSHLLCRFVCECPPDVKFNVDVINILIRSRLINMREFDIHLAQVSFSRKFRIVLVLYW